MRRDNYKEINAQQPLQAQFREIVIIKRKLNQKGRIITLLRQDMLWDFKGIGTGFQSRTIKYLMAIVLFSYIN